jgi:hypothetical protein
VLHLPAITRDLMPEPAIRPYPYAVRFNLDDE